MRSIRLVKLLLVGMVVLLTLMPIGAVWAVPPEQEIQTFDLEERLLSCSDPDFEVWANESVKLITQQFYDRDGNWTRTQMHMFHEGIWYNDENPEFWLQQKPDHCMVTWDGEGETWVGLPQLINLPGAGPIFFGAGRIVFDSEWNITFWAGPNDWVEGDTDALCAALSGP